MHLLGFGGLRHETETGDKKKVRRKERKEEENEKDGGRGGGVGWKAGEVGAGWKAGNVGAVPQWPTAAGISTMGKAEAKDK